MPLRPDLVFIYFFIYLCRAKLNEVPHKQKTLASSFQRKNTFGLSINLPFISQIRPFWEYWYYYIWDEALPTMLNLLFWNLLSTVAFPSSPYLHIRCDNHFGCCPHRVYINKKH